MLVEGPREVYLRARDLFAKSEDLDDAAELYFAGLNFLRYGGVIESDAVFSTALDLIKENGGDTREVPIEVRGKRELSIARREGASLPDDVGGGLGLGTESLRVPALTRRQRSGRFRSSNTQGRLPDRKLLSAHGGDANIRMMWHELNDDPEAQAALLRQLWTYRPTSRPPTSEEVPDGALIDTHPLEELDPFRIESMDGSRFHAMMRAIHDEKNEHDHTAVTDEKMRAWERVHSNHPHTKHWGKYESHHVGQHDIADYARGLWEKDFIDRFGEEPTAEAFANHMILRAEGLPEQAIYDTLYNEGGSFRGVDGFREGLEHSDRDESMQLGILPLMLGLHTLPRDEGADILGHFLQDGLSEGPKRGFLSGKEGTRELLMRGFNMNIAALQGRLTGHPSEYRKSAPRVHSGTRSGLSATREKGESHGLTGDEMLNTLKFAHLNEEGGWDREVPPIMARLTRDYGGLLPHVDEETGGRYAIEGDEPEMSDELLDKYVGTGMITEKQRDALHQVFNKETDRNSENQPKYDGLGAYYSDVLPVDGDDYKRVPSFSKPVFDMWGRGGGYARNHPDGLAMLDDMFPGVFGMRPSETVLDALIDTGDKKEDFDAEKARKILSNEAYAPLIEAHSNGEGVNVLPYHPDHELLFEGDNPFELDMYPWLGAMHTPRSTLFRIIQAMQASGEMKTTGVDVSFSPQDALTPLSRSNPAHSKVVFTPGLWKDMRDVRRANKIDSEMSGDGERHLGGGHYRPQSSFSLGSTYAQEPENDIGTNAHRALHHADLQFDLNAPAGEDSQFGEMFRHDPSAAMFGMLLDPTGSIHANHLHGGDPAEVAHALESAGYIVPQEGGLTTPLQQAEDMLTLYQHESEGGDHGYELGKRKYRTHEELEAFLRGESPDPPTLDIRTGSTGSVVTSGAADSVYALADMLGLDYDRVWHEGKVGEREGSLGLTRYPTLDEVTATGMGIHQSNLGQLWDDIPKYVLRSPDSDMGSTQRLAQVALAGGGVDYETVSDDSGGSTGGGQYVIASHPAITYKNLIQELSGALTRPEVTPSAEDSEEGRQRKLEMRRRLQQSIFEHKARMAESLAGFDWPEMSRKPEEGERKYSPIKRQGQASYMSRAFDDGVNVAGVMARALKAHAINQGHEDRFGEEHEGWVNHQKLLELGERMAHEMSPEQRKTFARHLLDEKAIDQDLADEIIGLKTKRHYAAPNVEKTAVRGDAYGRLSEAFGDYNRLKGHELLEHYLNSGHAGEGLDVEAAKRALEMIKAHEGHESFLGEMSDHYDQPSGTVVDDFNSLAGVMRSLHGDSHNTGGVEGVGGASLEFPRFRLPDPSTLKTRGLSKQKRRERFFTQVANTSFADFRLQTANTEGRMGLTDVNAKTAFPIDRTSVNSFFPPSLLTSAMKKRLKGTMSRPTIDMTMGASGIPEVHDMTWRVEGGRVPIAGLHDSEPLTWMPQDTIRHAFADPNLQFDVASEQDPTRAPYHYAGVGPVGEARTPAASYMGQFPSGETDMGDQQVLLRSLDMLTDVDLLYKDDDRDKGKPVPIKAMHRIFSLDDLEHLRGFTGDWIVSIWPEGARVIVQRKSNHVSAYDATGQSVDLPNSVRDGIRSSCDCNFVLDAVWDEKHLHIVDLISMDKDDMENIHAKDRSRTLRAKFLSTDEVIFPAPVNTRRTDDEGLQRAVDELLKEPEADLILLRDAESTYMLGEARHPKWVMLSPEKRVDVRIINQNGGKCQIGVGPLYEDVAEKLGNRAVLYDGVHYMDVGSVSCEHSLGDHITVGIDNVTVNTRNGESLYRLNGVRYLKVSESGATDSIETLQILSERGGSPIPHKVRIQKSGVLVSLPVGDVIYKAEQNGLAWNLTEPDAPHSYAERLADSVRPYWSPLAAILLRAEQERCAAEEKEKEYVLVDPEPEKRKKPKKVDEDQFFKDPEVTKTVVSALEMIEHLVKEKITWTGPRGLGFDYATPVESPHGPTELSGGQNLPDFAPADRQEDSKECWCGANEGDMCRQGMGHKMENCSKAHPPKEDKEEAQHLKIPLESDKE